MATGTFSMNPSIATIWGVASQIRLGLGTGAKDGQWHTFTRDLQADLTKAQSGATILQVNAFSVRGSGKIDNVQTEGILLIEGLFASTHPHMEEHPTV